MDDATNDPNYWLERAKDARQTAKHLKDQTMKNIMEDIAIGYDRIAEHIARNIKDGDHGSR
jgi:hypothetical protein